MKPNKQKYDNTFFIDEKSFTIKVPPSFLITTSDKLGIGSKAGTQRAKEADLFKNIYSGDSGKTLQNIKMRNTTMRSLSMQFDKESKIMPQELLNNESNMNSIIQNQSNAFLSNNASLNMLIDSSNKDNKDQNMMREIKEYNQKKEIITEQGIINSNSNSKHTKSSSLPGIKLHPTPQKSKTFLRQSVTYSQFFCPCCAHCNKMEEEKLDSHIFSIKEAKGILNKAVEYIISHNMVSKSNFDLFSANDNNSILYSNNISSETKAKEDFDVEGFHSSFPKQISVHSRETYKIVAYFLNALIDDKLSLNYLVPPELVEKFNQLLICKSTSFELVNDSIFFDKELEDLFDNKTKEVIQSLFKKKYLGPLKEMQQEKEKTAKEDTKKSISLFLIFIQLLAEISMECRERAVLLYKFFKMYFVEVEKKWVRVVNQMKEKVSYYKDLCRTVISTKTHHIDKIETINDVLFAKKLTAENLEDHKKLIHDLLKIINDKREEIYLVKANNEILLEELRLWVFDYDNLKLKKHLREQLQKFSVDNIVKNVNEEMRHKSLTQEVKSLLINADKFLIISGQRNYFYDQKSYYINEIERLSNLYQKSYFKKGNYKTKYTEVQSEMNREVDVLNKEINFLRSRLSVVKEEMGTQTDINFYEFNKMRRNHDLVTIHKRLTTNKLREFMDRIQYGCSKNEPIALKSLISFIPDLYNAKIESDVRADIDGTPRAFFDHFLFNYMTTKFKLKKIIKRNTEKFIMAVLKYANQDPRVDTLRQFLGIGDNKIRHEVFDMFLTLLRNLPISFFKLFDDTYTDYLMNTEICFEIYHSRYPNFYIVEDNKLNLMKLSTVKDFNDAEVKRLTNEKKLDYFLLNRFYNKSYLLIADLLQDFKTKNIIEADFDKIALQFEHVNREFKFTNTITYNIFKRNISFNKNKVNLDSFFDFFAHNKYQFKIKVFDFTDSSLSYLLMTFNMLEKIVNKYFDDADFKKIGCIYYKEFEHVMLNITNEADTNKWQINDYFKKACGSQDKDFLSKEDFISFFLNSAEMITILLSGISVNCK